VDRTVKKGTSTTVKLLCDIAGMSRQNYYKERKVRKHRMIDELRIVDLVRKERQIHPRIGCRKLHHMLDLEFIRLGVRIGRDRLFRVLRHHNMLINRRKSRPRTTDSGHGMRVYKNLLKDSVLTGPGQAFVSDITYIDTYEGFMYLSLVMDAYSRAIIGWDCSDSLETVGAMRALECAIASRSAQCGCIHHSDRGCQYASRGYVSKLQANGFRISMTEENHCYENASAERLNGILKEEYGLGGKFLSKSEVKRAVFEAIEIYNFHRPHQALGYRVPMAVHWAA
jgi:putative transposase